MNPEARRRWRSAGGYVQRQKLVEKAEQTLLSTATRARVAAVVPTNTPLRQALMDISDRTGIVELEWLSIKDVGSGQTHTLDALNNADLVIVQHSEKDPGVRSLVSYNLRVRFNLSHKRSIVFFDDCDDEHAMVRFSSSYYEACALIPPDGSSQGTSSLKSPTVCTAESPKSRIPIDEFVEMTFTDLVDSLRGSTTKEIWFREGVIKARNSSSSREQRMNELASLEALLRKNPLLLNQARLYDLLLTYRDLKAWDDMIRLVRDTQRLSDQANLPQIRYYAAFALTRRNLAGDRDAALDICNEICEIMEREGSGEAWGLLGRIHKDAFIASIDEGLKDYDACEEAIKAYQKVYDIENSVFGAVNLVTLLFASEDYEDRIQRISKICDEVNMKIADQGGVAKLNDYWDAASFFEVNFVADNHSLANQAARAMFKLAKQSWMVDSTMRNIRLIDRLRKERLAVEDGASLDKVTAQSESDPQKKELNFWCEFFLNSGKTSFDNIYRFPCLIQTTGLPRPAHVVFQTETDEDEAVISITDPLREETTIHRFLIHDILSFKLLDQKFPGDSDSSDRRRCHISASAPKGVLSITLAFSSQPQRQRLFSIVLEAGYTPSKDDEGEAVQDRAVEWQYDLVNGERQVLGQGATATVYKGLSAAMDEIAVKEVQKATEDSAPLDLLEEIRTIKNLQHRNIVKFFGYEEHPHNFILLMECVPGGSLTSLLYSFGSLLECMDNLVFYTRQIVEALEYLHGSDIVHRDVKGDNVLVNTFSGACKLADFGTSKRLAGLNARTDTLAGTPWFLAPEVIQSDTHDYGRESDIWSLGCTVWQMVTGKPPFVDIRDPHELMEIVGIMKESPNIEDSWPPALQNFLKSCFQVEWKNRPTAEQLLLFDLLCPPGMVRRSTSIEVKRKQSRSLSRQMTNPWDRVFQRSQMLDGLVRLLRTRAKHFTAAWQTALHSDVTLTGVHSTQKELDELGHLADIFIQYFSELKRDESSSLSDIYDKFKRLLGGRGRASSDFSRRLKKKLLAVRPSSSASGPALSPLASLMRNDDKTLVKLDPQGADDNVPNFAPHWIFFYNDVLRNCIDRFLSIIDSLSSDNQHHSAKAQLRPPSPDRQWADTVRSPSPGTMSAGGSSPGSPRRRMLRHTKRAPVDTATPVASSSAPTMTRIPPVDMQPVSALADELRQLRTALTDLAPSLASALKPQAPQANREPSKPPLIHQTSTGSPALTSLDPLRTHRPPHDQAHSRPSSFSAVNAASPTPAPPIHPPLQDFLTGIGCGQQEVIEIFARNYITYELLVNHLDESHLKEMHIPLGPRILIWRELQSRRELYGESL